MFALKSPVSTDIVILHKMNDVNRQPIMPTPHQTGEEWQRMEKKKKKKGASIGKHLYNGGHANIHGGYR